MEPAALEMAGAAASGFAKGLAPEPKNPDWVTTHANATRAAPATPQTSPRLLATGRVGTEVTPAVAVGDSG